MPTGEELFEELGARMFNKLVSSFGGLTIYVPKRPIGRSARIVQDYLTDTSLTMADVAQMHGVSSYTVKYHLLGAGVVIRNSRPRRSRGEEDNDV